jgi:transcriptional regulator with XRE-family HTH domain
MTTTKTKATPKNAALHLLGAKIKHLRGRRGLTQAGLAEALDISVAYVSLIERGGRNPPYTTVVAIAKALGLPTARLVADE